MDAAAGAASAAIIGRHAPVGAPVIKRGVLALVLGVAVPTMLLGAGWLAASVRERDSLEREQRALLLRTTEAVRAGVDESLEELRRREHARPFYLYNHFYSPEEVIAVNDPVAVTPLAGEPDDPRVVGYFQVEPGGAVRTPYVANDADPPPPRAAKVLAVARSPALASLRAMTGSEPAPSTLVAPGPAPEPPAAQEEAPHPRRPVRRRAPEPAEEPLAPEGPLTVNLNPWGNAVAEDIQAAQSGSPEANYRVQQRGRSAPITNRRDVTWDDVQQQVQQQQVQQQQAHVEQQQAHVRQQQAHVPIPQQAPPVRPQQTSVQREQGHVQSEVGTPPARPRRSRAVARERAPEREEPSRVRPLPPVASAQRKEEAVDYTRMTFRQDGDVLLLHRLVSHEGTAVVQGVLLDRRQIVSVFIPEVVRRQAVAGELPAVVSADDERRCAVRGPASRVIDGVDLCFPESALAATAASLDTDLKLQAGALAGLVLVVLLGVLAVYRASRRADELSRQKSAFVSAVSHELRTPLTTIRMHSEMLREGLVSEPRRERVHAELVHESVRLARLVENVLELSRIEEGRRPMKLRRADLSELVQEVAGGQRRFLEDRGFALVVRAPDEPLELPFDSQAVEQVLVNLIDNAAKYAAGFDPQEIEVELSVEGRRAVLRVLDRGPGIPESERERVFERFHRVERPETAHMPGTGIGLALVRDLARAHGGDAEVRAREGGGADVRVFLPLGAP